MGRMLLSLGLCAAALLSPAERLTSRTAGPPASRNASHTEDSPWAMRQTGPTPPTVSTPKMVSRLPGGWGTGSGAPYTEASSPTESRTTAAQTNPGAASHPGPEPLPPIRELLLQVERNQAAAEATQKNYTYHVHLEQQNFDSKGDVKKKSSTDSESLSVEGVRVDRVVARNGIPLTPAEARKEDERVDKFVAKVRDARAKRGDQKDDPNSDVVISAARILELGSFSNPRRVDLDGRPTLVVDYAGSPDVKVRNRFEGVVRDLVGTAWIDDQDRVLVRAQGHFLHDFKIGGGLIADVKSGSRFEIRYVKVNQEAWLPRTVDGEGRIRILLLTGFNGRLHLDTTDYKKFRTSTTIIQSDRVIGPDGQPIPQPTPPAKTQPAPPQTQSPGTQPGAHPAAPKSASPVANRAPEAGADSSPSLRPERLTRSWGTLAAG